MAACWPTLEICPLVKSQAQSEFSDQYIHPSVITFFPEQNWETLAIFYYETNTIMLIW